MPKYLPSVPPAKHCRFLNTFWYIDYRETRMLVWYVGPPFGRKIYDFEERRWGYID